MVDRKLKGKRIAIIAADMVEQMELVEPRKALEAAGAETELISLKPGTIQGFDHFDKADTHKVDRTVEEADAADYDGLMIPGGVGNPDLLRGDENMVAFTHAFLSRGSRWRRSATDPGCSSKPASSVTASSLRGRHCEPTSGTRAGTGSTSKSSSTAASSPVVSPTTSQHSTRR